MNIGAAFAGGLGLFAGYLLALWDYRRDRRTLEASKEFWRDRACRLQNRLNGLR